MFLEIIRKTPNKINITPIEILKVKLSLKNRIPKNIAVNGSNAPNIAVFVEPINFIAIPIVSKEIIVGNIAKPITKSHAVVVVKPCKFVQNFKLTT